MTVHLELEGAKLIEVSAAGPSSYSQASGFDITVGEARGVIAVLGSYNTGGYILGNLSFSKSSNTVTVHVFASGGSEVADATDLSGVTFTLLVLAF